MSVSACECVCTGGLRMLVLYHTALWDSIGEENTKTEGLFLPQTAGPWVYQCNNPHSVKTLSVQWGSESSAFPKLHMSKGSLWITLSTSAL